jgi:hypothetical protein
MPFDAAKATRWFKRELNTLRKLPDDDEYEKYLAQNRAAMEAYAAGRGSFGPATVGLLVIGGHEAAVGCARVADGKDDGWLQVDRACIYSAWEIHLLACAYDADVRPQKQPRTTLDGAANVWTQAESIGAVNVRDRLERRICTVDAGDGSLSGKHMNPLVALVAHFATGKDPAALKRSGWADIGPYGKVAAGTFRPEHYDELAEYHTTQVTDSGFPAFDRYPYRLIPFELFAIEKRTGIPIQNPKHPLLTSPFAVRREVREIPVPDDLRGVIERARTEMKLD